MDEDLARRIIAVLEDVAQTTRADLDDAPTIESWTVVAEPGGAPALIGRVHGHPQIPDGRLTHTSYLVAMSEREGWARTLNRFYRLGRPLEKEAGDVAH
ncbi:hypothetical protein IHQ68_04850 [Chelatococcus sambhunathii]|uniref:SnoaL-like domain-containing protein n=1 Tax=Chelatococcus sambhunathii TaxID=363953 RepID=A0ABU1DD37_9HYPH|nr:DUF6634 family protein [Chelatococcus sambhunathii]MDR4305953.1 hypothetical protein [Chelatococcus sambhunathii]